MHNHNKEVPINIFMLIIMSIPLFKDYGNTSGTKENTTQTSFEALKEAIVNTCTPSLIYYETYIATL